MVYTVPKEYISAYIDRNGQMIYEVSLEQAACIHLKDIIFVGSDRCVVFAREWHGPSELHILVD